MWYPCDVSMHVYIMYYFTRVNKAPPQIFMLYRDIQNPSSSFLRCTVEKIFGICACVVLCGGKNQQSS